MDEQTSPDGGGGLGCLGKAAEVVELSVSGDLCDGSTIGLRDDNVFTAFVDPTPGAATLAGLATKIGMGVETIKIDVAATEFTGRAY